MARQLNTDNTSFSAVNLTESTDVELVSYTATKDVLISVRADLGTIAAPLNSLASVIDFSAWITKTTGDIVEAYSKEVSKADSQTILPYTFHKKILLLKGEVVSVTANSDNISDISVNGDVYIIGDNATYDSTDFALSNLTALIELGSYEASYDYEVYIRVDIGSATYPLDDGSSSLTVIGETTQTSGVESISYESIVSKSINVTQIIYMLDNKVILRADESFALLLQSDNVSDISVSGTIYFALVSTTSRSSVLDWVKIEFLPLQFATPDETVYQLVENAIRYWNTHNGYKISTVVEAPTGTIRVQLDPGFKGVAQVYPTLNTEWILNDHPMWSLLGITILDNVTTDLIIMSEAFKIYRQYVGTNFHWHFERSLDQAVGGYLYLRNMPSKNDSLYVVGTKRITSLEDIKDDFILDWILYYVKALLKQVEGNTLRKSDIINIKNDGQALYDEGRDEQEKLKEKLSMEARWVALAKRF